MVRFFRWKRVSYNSWLSPPRASGRWRALGDPCAPPVGVVCGGHRYRIMPGSRPEGRRPRKQSSSNRRNARPRRVVRDVEEDAEKRANRREKNRLRQKIYRERQRTIIEKRKNDGENAAQREPSPPSYIPAHQRNAIDDFFNRLCRVETVLQVCSTCKESYHGMRLREGQCERCSNEVSPIFERSFRYRNNASLARFSVTDIVLSTRILQIRGKSLKSFVTCCRTSHKWRKCFAALHPRVF